MTRYRKKPVEVEAWQVGSEEPMPEWVRRRLPMFSVSQDGEWYVLEGGVYKQMPQWMFEQTYEVAE